MHVLARTMSIAPDFGGSSAFVRERESGPVCETRQRTLPLADLVLPPPSCPACAPAAVRGYAAHHEAESFEAFTSRYTSFFDSVEDLFELQRGLNNCFSYDLVPAPEVVESALRASRRVNDLSTAVRVFEGIKEKVENQGQYQKYLEALKPVRDELGACGFWAGG